MSTLLDEYRGVASDHGKHTQQGDHKKANVAHDRLGEILKSFVAAEEDQQLFSLYEDSDQWVQAWAAAHTLEIDEARAIAKLEELQMAEIPLVSMGAKYTIQEWKSGDLKFRE
jgi:hypothetical protein